ncbi:MULTISPECIES: KOW domain-containing RNA-binding protein [unclassified Clostridium]|uniref:KOW domain-containing RNA-binding protein n=1 Tax=Clostridium sp. TaxID=1506 RepID=UPI001A9AF405|nr:KOW domain-containing RNA-binding protein [Clostridium sp. cel8]
MTIDDCIGRVVLSKAGRDKGKFFIVIGISDENHVYISDGELRTIERPKKKKFKHLDFMDCKFKDIEKMLSTHQEVTNSMIKSFLQSYDKNKEV